MEYHACQMSEATSRSGRGSSATRSALASGSRSDGEHASSIHIDIAEVRTKEGKLFFDARTEHLEKGLKVLGSTDESGGVSPQVPLTARTDLRSDMKDFAPSCFHSASTLDANANAAPEGARKLWKRAEFWLRG